MSIMFFKNTHRRKNTEHQQLWTSSIKAGILVLVFFVFFLQYPEISSAKVFLTKDRALELVFPEADRIEKKHVFLSEQQTLAARQIARAEIDSKFYSFYVAKSAGVKTGYAVIDTHKMRTMTETVMFVIDPDGTLRQAEILAFFEPSDYIPSKKWITLFLGKDDLSKLQTGRGIPNITGATISAESFAAATRKVLAVYRVLFTNSIDSEFQSEQR